MSTPIKTAVKLAGGQSALGKTLGVSQQRVWHWLHKLQRVPAEYCVAIEKATGVSRHELRPDVFGNSPE